MPTPHAWRGEVNALLYGLIFVEVPSRTDLQRVIEGCCRSAADVARFRTALRKALDSRDRLAEGPCQRATPGPRSEGETRRLLAEMLDILDAVPDSG